MEILIGDALMRWNLINQAQLDAGLLLAEQTCLPLGKSLSALNLLSDDDLRTSVQVQSMLRDGILSESEADRVMHVRRVKEVSLSQALIMTGLISLSGPRARLGQLLIDCECLEASQLPRLLQICQKTGLPLGMVLLSSEMIHSRILDTVMRFQKLQRQTNNMCNFETLKTQVQKLRAAYTVQAEPDSRFGNLLLRAGIISKTELSSALEIASVNSKMIGELLVELAWIEPSTRDATLELQQNLRAGQTDLDSAAQILRSIYNSKSTLQDVLRTRAPEFTRNLLFGKFLIVSGFVAKNDMETVSQYFVGAQLKPAGDAMERTLSEDPCRIKDAVCRAGFAGPATTDAAISFWQAARDGMLPLVKAIVLLADSVLNEEKLMISKLVPNS